MTPEIISDFLTGYIRSLSEETRNEKKGPRYGFDHIIYELAQTMGLVPNRLSFYRQAEGELAKPKKEPEHGVDLAFVNADRTRLVIFVLKDEVLSYRNWTEVRFDYDLRRARDQDITVPELIPVKEVCVILAYNKDDDEEGIESFDKFVKSSGTKIGDRARLTFERWNLTTIVEKVQSSLLTPSLLPENFFKRFTYLCWQVNDFEHGSPQWREVLLPDWQEFLSSVLTSPVTERSIRLVSVALVILRSHGKKSKEGKERPSFATGWIDLAEWAALALWSAVRNLDSVSIKRGAYEIWVKFYLGELEQYYERNAELLAAEHSLELSGGGGLLNEGASAYLAYWHMGRLGILAMVANELRVTRKAEVSGALGKLAHKVANWIVGMLNANPSCHRPLLDVHHIEIFLVWRALIQCGRWDDALHWFNTIFERLLYRRLGKAGCRVIDYSNSWDSLFDYLATEEEPNEGFGKSSYLLLMILEIAVGAPEDKGLELAHAIHRQLILGLNGKNSDFEKLPFKETVELMGWLPPENWTERILRERVFDGVALPAHFTSGEDLQLFSKQIRDFVQNTRQLAKWGSLGGAPHSLYILSCMKRVSPLPSEFWRTPLYGTLKTKKTSESDRMQGKQGRKTSKKSTKPKAKAEK
jgi:hypothetical protein